MESYHTLAKRRPDDLKVAGCWAHAKRKYADIIKAAGKNSVLSPTQELAAEAIKRIDTIYHKDNLFKESSEEDRLDNRQKQVKPLVISRNHRRISPKTVQHIVKIHLAKAGPRQKLKASRCTKLFNQSGALSKSILGGCKAPS